MDFSSKIDQKPTKKTRKATFATNIDKNAFLGASFLAKNQFFAIFGVPRGTQKLSKIYAPVVTKWSWKPSGGHFGRFTAFYSISGPFWVHSQPLRANFLACLVRFSTFSAPPTAGRTTSAARQLSNTPTTASRPGGMREAIKCISRWK